MSRTASMDPDTVHRFDRLTLRSTGQTEDPTDRCRDPAFGEPEDGTLAEPPDEDELGSRRRYPDDGGEAPGECRSGGSKGGIWDISLSSLSSLYR
jgi:hypothetical protein